MSTALSDYSLIIQFSAHSPSKYVFKSGKLSEHEHCVQQFDLSLGKSCPGCRGCHDIKALT